MNKDKMIDKLWEQSSHGARREDVEAAYNAGALAEREACAVVCESMGAMDAMDGEEEGSSAMVRVADRQAALCAAAIRERSNG